MKLYHATTADRAKRIRTEGLRVACADPAAKIKGCWMTSASARPWAVLHTIRKHHASLEDVVVLEITVPRSWLTRFRTGLWYASRDIPADRIGGTTPGTAFGASASE